MAAFEGPYVYLPSETYPGNFTIRLATIPREFPIAIVPRNLRNHDDVEDTARLLAAAPMLLKSLEVLAAAPDLDPDLLAIALHAIDVATKAKT